VTARETVDGLLVRLLFVLAGLAAAVGGLFLGARRLGYGLRDLLALVRRLPGLAVRYARLGLVVLVTRGSDLLRAGLAGLRRGLETFAALLRGQVSVAALWRRLRVWYRERRSGRASGGAVDTGGAGEGHLPVRAAWQRLVEGLSVRRPETKTPGELATHAVERDGLPADAVGTLRDAFREVEYGARSADERLGRVQSALATLDRASDPETDTTGGAEPRADTGTAADGGTTTGEPGADGTHAVEGGVDADITTDAGREGDG